jgi:polysaccharide pyruvyl transferase WcaK-like protein
MIKVFTSSWGQLERTGSNVGDEAIFAAQVKDLSSIPDLSVGVMSADPARTKKRFGAVPFDVSAGRLKAMRQGVRWSDIVIVGGGELAQDRSSLLYTPYNLMPLRLAKSCGKPAFAWSVGIGQGEELARWTPGQLARWLGYCRGVTVRDRPSHEFLLGLGLDPEKVLLSSDSTFSLADEFPGGGPREEILGVAIRNVSNRQGRLLPLEIRRKLGIYRDPDMSNLRMKWAALLDRHLEEHGGVIHFFPFHTGSLSNSDDTECEAVMTMMKHHEKAEIVSPLRVREFMERISRCRVFLTVPLHGAILSVVTGTVPISVPYASKGFRFMEEAGIGRLAVSHSEPDWDSQVLDLIAGSWSPDSPVRQEILTVRSRLAEACRLNLQHFTTCLIGDSIPFSTK